jgi:hypothetical protein
MKKIIYTVFAFFLTAGIIIAESGWYTLSCGLNVYWYSVYFTSNSTGYVADNEFILKTIDGGDA